ncbi:MAG: amino acid ABC transporter substrate-binding protein [Ruminococcaceae bacterium]|nr:amino acid ABC transporter substrate-binding protein [Oscillospiraceae bacterium]
MKKTLALLLALMMCLVAFTACGGDDESSTASTESKADSTSTDASAESKADIADAGWTYIENNGKIVVGLDDTFAPMGFRDEANNLVGFDIDLANAVGEVLGVSVEFKPIDWNAKEMELSEKKIDCIWNGMSATPARQESMALTNKYLNNRIVIMTLNGDVKVASAADLANYKIGTQTDSAALEVIEANEAYASYKDNITTYPTYDEAILDMETGRIDCIVVDEVLGEYKNSKRETKLVLCEYDFGDDFYAIGCRKEDTDVAAKINEAIATLIENGKAAEISNKWFGKDIVINQGYDK